MDGVGFGRTDDGCVRDHNEDCFHVDNDRGFYLVCDGMGGHAAGEVASETAVVAAAATINQLEPVLTRVIRGKAPVDEAVQLMERAAHNACRAVFEKAASTPGAHGMGTTYVGLLVVGTKAVVAHVGDSRCYLIRGGEAHQLTSDHTVVTEMVQRGLLTPDQARDNPHAHVLSRALGLQPAVEVDVLPMDVLEGDRFILCSDGLGDYLESPEHLLQLLPDDLDGLPGRLVEFAKQQGGKDNVTVLAVDVLPSQAEDEQPEEATRTLETRLKLDVITESFLFRDMPFAHVSRVLQISRMEAFDEGQLIVEEGSLSSTVYIILEGEVSLRRGEEHVGLLKPGDVVGQTTLMAERASRAALVAGAECRVLRIEHARFVLLMQRRPFLGIELLTRLVASLGGALDASREREEECAVRGDGELPAAVTLF